MKVTAIKTHKITDKDTDILAILDRYLPPLKENTIVAVASKIVGITEGNILKITTAINKEMLIISECTYYLPKSNSKYNQILTIKNGMLAVTAGIDESNANGYYILWPRNPQKSANRIREHLAKKYQLKNIGVIITDSKTTPLCWGVTGFAIAHSGFKALYSYIGKKDIFGRKFQSEKTNVADSLATVATLAGGEGKEQSPLVIIKGANLVVFQSRNPTEKEIKNLHIALEDDLYEPILKHAPWKKGKK